MSYATTAADAATRQVREFYRRVIAPGLEWGYLCQEGEGLGGDNVYRLYAAEHYVGNGHGRWEDCVLAVSAGREKSLREDIESGRRLLKLGPMLYETPDLAQAIEHSDLSFL